MAQVKASLQLDREISGQTSDVRTDKQKADANQPRPLDDLELAIIAGGEAIPCW